MMKIVLIIKQGGILLLQLINKAVSALNDYLETELIYLGFTNWSIQRINYFGGSQFSISCRVLKLKTKNEWAWDFYVTFVDIKQQPPALYYDGQSYRLLLGDDIKVIGGEDEAL